MGQQSLINSVYAGLVSAFLASLVGAILLKRLGIDQESLEGFFLLSAAVFVISMIVWMWVTAKRIRAEIENKMNGIIARSTGWKARLGAFSFTFFMIAREGIETAIFLQAVALSAGAWRSILGTAIGLSLASVFAVLFIRGSLKIDVARFLKVTAVTLLFFAFQLILDAVHEFYEYGILPSNPNVMGILGPIVQNELLFIAAIIGIPAFMLMIPSRRDPTDSQALGQKRWQLGAAFLSIALMLFLGAEEVLSSSREVDFSAQDLPVPPDSVIEIPLQQVSDGLIHRYQVKVDSLQIRFFVLRTEFGEFTTAFEACYACYSYGRYYLKKRELICSQCDAPSPLSSLRLSTKADAADQNNIGSMEGSRCAPIYLRSRIDHGNVVVAMRDLISKRKYFNITPER